MTGIVISGVEKWITTTGLFKITEIANEIKTLLVTFASKKKPISIGKGCNKALCKDI